MNIDKYISDLLYRYQCVTVPGFGAFLTELKSAQIDSNNVMSPPKKVVSFNPHLINNDGLLANHISLEEKISYSEAVVYLKNQVNNWQLMLEQEESINLPSIGDIVLNKEGNLLFTPFNTVNYESNSFGLTNIVAPEVTRENNPTKNDAKVAVNEVKDVFAPSAALKQTFNSTNEEQIEDIKPIIKSKNKTNGILKAVAVIALLTGGGLLCFKMFNDSKVENETEIVQKNVQDKLDKKIQEATFVLEEPESAIEITTEIQPVIENTDSLDTVNSNSEKTPYHIVAGSFRNNDNALNKVKDLKSKGFKNASIVGKNSHDLYIVAYKSYSSIKKANEELKEIHKSDNDQAWILTK